MTHLELHF
jgi:hypothetical protein